MKLQLVVPPSCYRCPIMSCKGVESAARMYDMLLVACGNSGDYEMALKILERMKSTGMEWSSDVEMGMEVE